MGELHPSIAAAYDMDARVYLAELNLDMLLGLITAAKTPQYKPASRYPSAERDIALLVKNDIPAAEVERAIAKKGGALLARVSLFDVYTGKQVGDGYKSMAYNLSFCSPERTLTDDEAAERVKAILDYLNKELGITLR
jgi:phenylalanyl-tRNA synthetase beta chain